VLGPEPWAERAGRLWTHWDLWFATVAVCDHGGSLDGLESRLATELRDRAGGRRASEAKLSHLADLRSRLAVAGCSVATLATPEVLAEPRLVERARAKVSADAIDERALTPSMRETPRARHVARARRGRWSAFPVDPLPSYEAFRGVLGRGGYVSKYQSFALVRRVEQRLERLDRRDLASAQRLALFRAFHAVGCELAERVDDSHGNVGELRRAAWHTYLSLDWEASGVPAEVFWEDLCDLVVFEDYGLGHAEETLPWRNLPASQVEAVEGYLLGLASQCRSQYLDFQADEALQQLAWLAVAGRRFGRYVAAAARLGSDHWMPIEAMALSALRAGRRALAVEVFEAADRPGFHRAHLRQRCLVLTGVDLEAGERRPGTVLRIVQGGSDERRSG